MSSATSTGSTGRYDTLVVLAVGALSVAVGALYLWAIHDYIIDGGVARYVVFLVVNTLAAGLLWWHRQHSLLVFSGVMLVLLTSSMLTGQTGSAAFTLPLWFSVYAVAAYAPFRLGLIVVAAGWLLSTSLKVGLAIRNGLEVTVPEIGLVTLDIGFFFVACSAVGYGFRLQRQRASDAAERARLVEKHSRAVNAEAVATERNRLARDLHDLAAHEVMDVLLSLRALRLTNHEPILTEVEEKTARALDNMRMVVRALREEDVDDPARSPLDVAARELIDAVARERGIAVDSHVRVPARVGDAAASTVLSILKEALLNADAHAPGHTVTVALDADGDRVQLTVTNPTSQHLGSEERSSPEHARNAGTGYGLVGAAERAALLGGMLEAAPTPNGDWIVALTLPNPSPADRAYAVGRSA
ncbi:sensor histidine kinase [Brachybacterium tyrofermentans]|uniref:sensor histidine kinase n=1 Tax=Brachybacterium tyrofermentans TaxID=47848 RepID=UPI001868F0BD|nr:histidine kinase [Brachybacterium tyrofermentans]